MNGTDLRFETIEHGGEYPDTMPQAIKLVDAGGPLRHLRADLARPQGGRQSRVCARSGGRRLSIQAVDIHEFKDGKILRTWHTEDWMTGLNQLGAFER